MNSPVILAVGRRPRLWVIIFSENRFTLFVIML
jgi:hypothetical protein